MKRGVVSNELHVINMKGVFNQVDLNNRWSLMGEVTHVGLHCKNLLHHKICPLRIKLRKKEEKNPTKITSRCFNYCGPHHSDVGDSA